MSCRYTAVCPYCHTNHPVDLDSDPINCECGGRKKDGVWSKSKAKTLKGMTEDQQARYMQGLGNLIGSLTPPDGAFVLTMFIIGASKKQTDTLFVASPGKTGIPDALRKLADQLEAEEKGT